MEEERGRERERVCVCVRACMCEIDAVMAKGKGKLLHVCNDSAVLGGLKSPFVPLMNSVESFDDLVEKEKDVVKMVCGTDHLKVYDGMLRGARAMHPVVRQVHLMGLSRREKMVESKV